MEHQDAMRGQLAVAAPASVIPDPVKGDMDHHRPGRRSCRAAISTCVATRTATKT
jgi:hypothetical protein